MKKFRLSFLIVLSINVIQILRLFADDTYVEIAGGAAKIMDEHNSISMVSEYVIMDITKSEYYTVDASFEFYNNGVDTETVVGFPQVEWVMNNDDLKDEEFSNFVSFKTFINESEAKTVVIPNSEKKTDVKKWIIKTVKFPSQKVTKTRVIYKAPYGDVSGRTILALYLYGTGGSWYGSIGKVIFDLRFSNDTWIQIENSNYLYPFMSLWWKKRSGQEIPMVIFKRRKNEMIWELKDIEPQPNDYFKISLGGHGRHIPWGYSFDWDKNKLDEPCLELLSMWQLKIFRNEFYARHGRIFKDKKLQEYFESQDWYKPNPNFSEKMLNKTELENIKKIKDYETKIEKEK
ncbi:MAG: YARHG domain-containing protein [Elusimicrobiota bacterium]